MPYIERIIQAQEAEDTFQYALQRLALLQSILAAYSRAAEHDEFDGCVSWEAFNQLEHIVEETRQKLGLFGVQLVQSLEKHGPLIG